MEDKIFTNGLNTSVISNVGFVTELDGIRREYYVDDVLHRINGPAVECYCNLRNLCNHYYLHNKNFNFNDYWKKLSVTDFSMEVFPKGVSKIAVNNNIINPNIEFKDDQDKLHCDDGPSVICKSGDIIYYFHDQIHRLDGPAIINSYSEKNEYEGYYIRNKKYSKEEYYNLEEVKSYINKRNIQDMTNIFKGKPWERGYHSSRVDGVDDRSIIFMDKNGNECNSSGPTYKHFNDDDYYEEYSDSSENTGVNGPCCIIYDKDSFKEKSFRFFLEGEEYSTFDEYFNNLVKLDFNNQYLPKGTDSVSVDDDQIVFTYKNNISCADGPSVIYKNGDVKYQSFDRLHRLDGPALDNWVKKFKSPEQQEHLGYEPRYFIFGKELSEKEYYSKPEVISFLKEKFCYDPNIENKFKEKEECKMSQVQHKTKPSIVDTLKIDATEALYSTGADTAVKLTQRAFSRGLEATGNDNAMILSMILQNPAAHSVIKMVMGIGLAVIPQAAANQHAAKVAEKMRQNAIAEGMGYVADEVIELLSGLTEIVSELPGETQSKLRVNPALAEAKQESHFMDEQKNYGNQQRISR